MSQAQVSTGASGRSGAPSVPGRVLLAGMGNVLRGDDGFGPAVVRALRLEGWLPEWADVVEVGIGGVGLVHELMSGYRALVLVDAVDRGGAPGSVHLLEPDLSRLQAMPLEERRKLAADHHRLLPAGVLVIAQALGVLPPVVRIVGCQPAETEELSIELSPSVQQAVPAAVEAIRSILDELEVGEG